MSVWVQPIGYTECFQSLRFRDCRLAPHYGSSASGTDVGGPLVAVSQLGALNLRLHNRNCESKQIPTPGDPQPYISLVSNLSRTY
jgi:hypothetical protein